MKKLISVFLVLCMAVLFTGCASTKVIDGVKYDTCGLIDSPNVIPKNTLPAMNKANPNIEYKIVWGNVVWGTLLWPLIIPSVYFFGFSMYEPVCKKGVAGQIGQRDIESFLIDKLNRNLMIFQNNKKNREK